ncbi:hypothetical protein [Paraburkholderia guartelaensis]|uniref:hypothetical protein n=1 Tax=Paraburkholderia guartelaensis TaxID=2546446 RepID=UPI002AB6277A|nr:hypothetical protein [Paraburkholderia guartelaensis]
MINLMLIWLGLALTTALAIAFDMRRLRVNYVWLSMTGWSLLCACAGAAAAIPYLALRWRVRRNLIAAAWALIGDESHTPELRQQRLIALKQSGLVGDVVFRICLRRLNDVSDQIAS